jgi:ABC-type multidrug transport system fused ATPase/permease subunit
VRGALELDRVSFSYPSSERPALREVSLSVEPGETVALVGPSGAGKSTITRMLVRLHDPDRGSLRIDGHDLRDVTMGSLRERVSILFQETLVMRGTVAENIGFSRPAAGRAEIEAAARAAGAHEFIEGLPDGYDSDLGERGRRLSGGQRQRVAIARALLADAPVLLLDEPTTGLDAEAREALVAPLRKLMRGRTTVVVSHDLLTTRDADRIVVLDRGRVVEQGPHDELVAAGGLYARLWELHRTQPDQGPLELLTAEQLLGAPA